MTIRTLPWRRRLPMLLLATVLHALIILVFLHGLTLAGHASIELPLLVSVVTPPPRPVPPPPALHAPKLPEAPIPVLIPPSVVLPHIVTVPASAPAHTPRIAAPRLAAGSGNSSYFPPQITYKPPDVDNYYPMSARRNSAQGRVWTRVCIYSTGQIASIAVLRSSGDYALDQAALKVAHLTRWKPAMSNGKPVARCLPFSVQFSMGERSLLLH
ncbi:MAG TPA: energy transducer TonB [Steroidobacteraceae bacterium]|jgi:TonB family protein|nr:energy transducer TonB [Steroidobacteraceae bacterium]